MFCVGVFMCKCVCVVCVFVKGIEWDSLNPNVFVLYLGSHLVPFKVPFKTD